MIKWILLSLFFSTSVAYAAAGGDHHGVPWKMVITQVFNFILVIALLTYLLRKKAKEHFKERVQEYHALITRAESAKVEAENNKKQITERLAKLEQTADSSIQQAKAEAQELKSKILEEANNLSKKLEEEARKTVDFEIQRAKEQLRRELLEESVEDARKAMKEGVQDPDLKRLQNEFVQRVQVVSQ